MPLSPDKERERQARKHRKNFLQVANVEVGKCKEPDLYKACEYDLHRFLQECFPESTGLKPFGMQVEAIERMQHCILHGGRFAQAFPRGYAKTSISARSAIWGVLFGHRQYIPVYGSNESASQNLIDGMKTELAENPILLDLFPHLACVRALEGKAQRCHSQHVDGAMTYIRWTADKVVLPTVEGCIYSGSILQARSMRAARGLQYTNPNGQILRPDFVILDDVQTEDDAISVTCVQKLVTKIKKSILRGGGHSSTLAAVMNCTVIAPDDVAEKFLEDPGWQSCRYKMVEEFPDNMELWEGPYKELLLDYDNSKPESQKNAQKRAMNFYKEHREEMDAGSKCSWDWAYAWDDPDPHEISAIQHALNIKFEDGDDVFLPECQNTPIRITDGLSLSVQDVVDKMTPVSAVPQEAVHLVCHIDVQGKCLVYTIAGVSLDYTGAITHSGIYPEQPEPYFRVEDPPVPFDHLWPGESNESQIYKALGKLCDQLRKTRFVREDGVVIPLTKILIDSGWKRSTVELFCRHQDSNGVIMPARGIGIGAKHLAIDEKPWNPKPGEVRGHNWEIKKTSDETQLQVVFDANYYKTFVWERFALGTGSPSAWRINEMHPKRLLMLAEEVCAEFPTRVTGRGREVDEWQLLPGRRNNHRLDNCVGIAVAASIVGCRLPNAHEDKPKKKRTRVSFQRRR